MSRRLIDRIDVHTQYQGLQNLDEFCEIEKARVDQVLEANPPEERIERELYIPTDELKTVVNLAIALGRPLLLQGDPGCGKTRLAYAVAYELKLPLEGCYIKSTSRAQDLLYTYDAVNRLYDVQQNVRKPIKDYVHIGPLGRAIVRAQYGRRSVVLIDEIDKADLDFPNDLLYELDRLAFTVSEDENIHYSVPEIRPDLRPIVIITHNEEKTLPSAFLRRCVYHYVTMPDDKRIMEIFSLNGLTNQTFNEKAIEVLKQLQQMKLPKPVGLSELLEWAGYQMLQGVLPKDLGKVLVDGSRPFEGAIIKGRADQEEAHRKSKPG